MPWTPPRPKRSANGCERSSTRVSETVGTIAALWRFPVKAMRGERLASAALTTSGIAGDRAYALRDAKTGEVMNAKHPRIGHALISCRATTAGDSVEIAFPDGTSIATDAPGADDALSAF